MVPAPWHSSAASQGGAGGWREAAVGAGVVELEEVAVWSCGDEGVVGGEVDVGAIGADADETWRAVDAAVVRFPCRYRRCRG